MRLLYNPFSRLAPHASCLLASFVLLCTPAQAKIPDSLKRAEAHYERAIADSDALGLQRTSTLAVMAVDAREADIKLLQGKALLGLSRLLLLKDDVDLAKQKLKEGLVALNQAVAASGGTYASRAYRLLAADLMDALEDTPDNIRLLNEADLQFLQEKHGKEPLTLLVQGMRAVYAMEDDLQQAFDALPYFTALYQQYPQDRTCAAYYWYLTGLTEATEKPNAMRALTALVDSNPRDRLAIKLRGQLGGGD